VRGLADRGSRTTLQTRGRDAPPTRLRASTELLLFRVMMGSPRRWAALSSLGVTSCREAWLSPATRRSDAHHRIPTSGTCKTGYTETTLLPKAEQEKLEKVLPIHWG